MTLTKRIPATLIKLRKIANRFLAKTIQATKVLASAHRTGFVKRSTSRIDGSEFVKALVETSMHPAPVPLSGIVDTRFVCLHEVPLLTCIENCCAGFVQNRTF